MKKDAEDQPAHKIPYLAFFFVHYSFRCFVSFLFSSLLQFSPNHFAEIPELPQEPSYAWGGLLGSALSLATCDRGRSLLTGSPTLPSMLPQLLSGAELLAQRCPDSGLFLWSRMGAVSGILLLRARTFLFSHGLQNAKDFCTLLSRFG